jgi:uroporphyrin-III C-methyltransferase
MAKITLLGAGIGDPDLITIKGMKALQMADVVLYDALSNSELLNYCPAHCLKIFVGKRADDHTFNQESINEMLVQYANSHGHVVRLKGGDPFVFGRGHEELESAKAAGIEIAVIPGISSSIAAPELAGIPVTRRKMSDSFWVMTAHNTEGGLPDDLKMAVKTDATVVLLMGVAKLNAVVEIYTKEGKKDLPIAIIQNASLPNQKSVIATIETIENEVKKHNIGTPAVIVIGKVAALGNSDILSEIPLKNAQNVLARNEATGGGILYEKHEIQNELFPVFLKLNQLKVLIVGGGYVGLEKVTAVLQNSPKTDITLVAPEIRDEIVAFSKEYPTLKLVYKSFEIKDLEDKDIAIVATNFKDLNKEIKAHAKAKRILCNVADTPDECDFYLSSIVKKGSLKLAISTNGKSPTMAKRIREAMEGVFPDELEASFQNLRAIRATLKGNFEEKVRALNEITTVISEKNKACKSEKCNYPVCSWEKNTEGCPYFINH